MKAKATEFARSLAGVVLPMYKQGFSLRGIADRLNMAHIATPRGGGWNFCGVRRAIVRLRPETALEGEQEAV